MENKIITKKRQETTQDSYKSIETKSYKNCRQKTITTCLVCLNEVSKSLSKLCILCRSDGLCEKCGVDHDYFICLKCVEVPRIKLSESMHIKEAKNSFVPFILGCVELLDVYFYSSCDYRIIKANEKENDTRYKVINVGLEDNSTIMDRSQIKVFLTEKIDSDPLAKFVMKSFTGRNLPSFKSLFNGYTVDLLRESNFTALFTSYDWEKINLNFNNWKKHYTIGMCFYY